MALLTKIKLTPNYDWKSILLEDITGTGITGYGSNQSPAGYRREDSVNKDIKGIRIIVTSPSGTVTNIDFATVSLAYTVVSESYSILHTLLGFNEDDSLEDGLWKIKYITLFENPNPATLTFSTVNKTATYTVTSEYFRNANMLYYAPLSVIGQLSGTFYNIVNNNLTTKTMLLLETPGNDVALYNTYYVGYSKELHVPISKSIKECLDNKIADITNCECEDVDCELVNKYLLYDAMFVNCKEGNLTKAQQIFDLLTIYCTDNCGC
jgi:hypothetical protein